MIFRRAALLALLSAPAFSQTRETGDAWIQGTLGVGTTSPGARLEVKASSATAIPFLLYPSDDGVYFDPFPPLGMVDRLGRVGLSTTPATNFDVSGFPGYWPALELRNGGPSTGTARVQIAFGYAGQAQYRHVLRSRHADSLADNALDFLLWTPAAPSASDLPSLHVLSLVTTSTRAAVHVRPSGTPDVELEVSDGSATGGGTVHRALEAAHSSRNLKKDIVYLADQDEQRAYEELRELRPAWFRYMRRTRKGLVRDARQPLRRGLVLEDAPASVRGPGGTVVLDERVTNAELALKELFRRLEAAQVKAESAQGWAP